jgi:uncharacterized protein YggE
MPRRNASTLFLVAGLAAVVALVPTARAGRAAPELPCTPAAYAAQLTSFSSASFGSATAVPTPSFEGTGAERTVTVTGTGAVERPPDTAYLDVRLVANGVDAASAACVNERAYAALRAKLAPTQVENGAIFPGPQAFVARPTPPPAGSSAAPVSAPLWVSSRPVRIVAAPGAELQNAAKTVVALGGTLESLHYAVTDREPAYEGALAAAVRDAAEQARTIAASERLRAGRIVRVEVAVLETSSAGTNVVPGAALEPGVRLEPVAVHASVRATFPLVKTASGAQPGGALIVLHPYGLVSRLPEIANLNVEFTDRDNDRTAMLYRHETAYDALWAKLRALGIVSSQVPSSTPQTLANRRAGEGPAELVGPLAQPPRPTGPPTPFVAYSLYRLVRVTAVPVDKVPAVMAAFAEAGGKTADVTFSVADRASVLAVANAALRRNAASLAKTVASAAGLRLVEPPYIQNIGYPAVDATIFRTLIGSPDRPRSFEPPARLYGFLSATVVYAATR